MFCVVLHRMISRTLTIPLFLQKERENMKTPKGRDGHNPALLMVRQGFSGLQKGAECKAAAGTNKTRRHGAAEGKTYTCKTCAKLTRHF